MNHDDQQYPPAGEGTNQGQGASAMNNSAYPPVNPNNYGQNPSEYYTAPYAASPGGAPGVAPSGFTNSADVRNSAQYVPYQEKSKHGPGWGATVAIALASSLAVFGASGALTHVFSTPLEKPETSMFDPKEEPAAKPGPVAHSTSQNPDWEAVAKAVRPSVVAIQVTSATEAGSGSGVILDTQGHILTNNHVVAPAANNGQIAVELWDGRIFPATIKGTDVKTDLAVIKIDTPPKDLSAASLGNSDKLQVGESVVAIGNPLGLSSTVTTGIVSALDRPVIVEAPSEGGSDNGSRLPFNNPFLPRREAPSQERITTNAIQVDAAINPGNSGGPLFDAQGRVIGINSSIASLSADATGQAGSIGLGFAIPINLAKRIGNELIEKGKATHASLGVRVVEESVTVDGVTRLGAKIMDVTPASAAAKAGLRNGDVVVGIDSNRVTGASSLVGWVRRYAVGNQVKLQVVRGGKEIVLPVTLQAQDE